MCKICCQIAIKTLPRWEEFLAQGKSDFSHLFSNWASDKKQTESCEEGGEDSLFTIPDMFSHKGRLSKQVTFSTPEKWFWPSYCNLSSARWKYWLRQCIAIAMRRQLYKFNENICGCLPSQAYLFTTWLLIKALAAFSHQLPRKKRSCATFHEISSSTASRERSTYSHKSSNACQSAPCSFTTSLKYSLCPCVFVNSPVVILM